MRKMDVYLLHYGELATFAFVGEDTDIESLRYYCNTGQGRLVAGDQERFVDLLNRLHVFANAEEKTFRGKLFAWKFNRRIGRKGLHMGKIDFAKAAFLMDPADVIRKLKLPRELAEEWASDNRWLEEFGVDAGQIMKAVQAAY